MIAYLNRDNMLVMKAQSVGDVRTLKKMYDQGHVHFVCKALTHNNRTRLSADRPDAEPALRLFLTVSAIRWRRPLRGLGAQPRRRPTKRGG